MSLLDYAIEYAEAGWSVFPVHGIADDRCTCGKQDCSSPGKHPIYSGGFQIASTDKEKILAWWSVNPQANIGIATGEVSNLLVIDVDVKPGTDGFAALALLEQEFEQIPLSSRVQTGSGGLHIYLAMPDSAVSCSASKLGHGLDIRANGGYVVAPPSNHISGKTYVWETANE